MIELNRKTYFEVFEKGKYDGPIGFIVFKDGEEFSIEITDRLEHGGAMLKEKVGDFERIVEFVDARDRRNDGYSVSDAKVSFVLKNDEGAVVFMMRTGVYSNDWDDDDKEKMEVDAKLAPLGVTTHSYVPRWEQDEPTTNKCMFLDGKPCYSTTNYITAFEPFNAFMENGIEALWEWLEEHHKEVFSEPVYIPIHYVTFHPSGSKAYIVKDYSGYDLGAIKFDSERWRFAQGDFACWLTEGQMKKIAEFIEDLNDYQ